MPMRDKSKHATFDAACVVDAVSFTVGAKVGSTINVAMQFQDADKHRAIWQRGGVVAYLSNNSDGSTVASAAPTGGAAIGTNGLAIPLVAGKVFELISNATGQVDVTLTDSGTPLFYFVVVLPNGGLSISSAIQF